MKRLAFVTVLLMYSVLSAEASWFSRKTDTLTIMSYNIENFFDPADDPNKNDDDFTPEGAYHWTEHLMQVKAGKIARVVSTINGWNIPDIIGLSEIEGPDAVEQLLRRGKLRRYYKSVVFQTSDRRGIATAMLYRKGRVDLLCSKAINVSAPSRRFFTRDILYAKLKVRKDTFHIFVNHWPSKRGKGNSSDALRDSVAAKLRLVTDSIVSVSKDANIVLLGDFNDEETSYSLTDVLGAAKDTLSYREDIVQPFVNLSTLTKDKSYKYQGIWKTIDHIIVTKTMMKRFKCSFRVFKPDYLLQEDTKYQLSKRPFRTYLGQKFNDGYSDHLPVIAKIVLNNNL